MTGIGDISITEPCPHCAGTGTRTHTIKACGYCRGTGTRIKAPPPKQRGGQTTPGKTHGYESTYVCGCRCPLCRAAHRDGNARRRKRTADA